VARRKDSTPVEPDDPRGPVLPFELAFNLGSDEAWGEFYEARGMWLREHGIDIVDRAAVAEVLRASRRVYGAVDSLSRARIMAEGRAAHGVSGA